MGRDTGWTGLVAVREGLGRIAQSLRPAWPHHPCRRPVRQAESGRGICSECLDSRIIERGPTVNRARIDQLLTCPGRHHRSEVHVA